MQQFKENIGRVNKISKEWDKKHKVRKHVELKGVEKEIKELYDKNKDGVFKLEEVGVLKQLEGKKDSLLL